MPLMKSLDEMNKEKSVRAAEVFHPAQIRAWEEKARQDAEANNYQPPHPADTSLAAHVYLMAYSRRKYKIAKAKREEPST